MTPFMSAPFRQFGNNTTLAASTTSASGALSRAADQNVVVVNPHATAVAFVKFGTSGVVATANDFPVAPLSKAILAAPETATHVATILSTGTGNVYVSAGDGSVV